VDALVHLAAIPAPGIVPNHATFADDMNATWNIVTDARDGAQAIRLALGSDLTGCEIFVIANADTVDGTQQQRSTRRVLPGRRDPGPDRFQ
jgi:hypothetical protein